jgi:acyl carrier protein
MSTVQASVQSFILDNLLFGDESRMPAPGDSLIQTGIIDSTGILELVEYLEQEFHIKIEDTETLPENLDGLDRITDFVHRKQTERDE